MTPREIGQLALQGLVIVLLFASLYLRVPGISLEIVIGLVGAILGSSLSIHSSIVASSLKGTNNAQ